MNQLVQYAKDVLGPVIDYNSRRKSDLFGTLSVYLSQRESPTQSARVLRVHLNTVLYRIERIQSLTSLDLTNPDHLLSAHVAMKIIQSQRASLSSLLRSSPDSPRGNHAEGSSGGGRHPRNPRR
jgi:DNA-binding PucR family transcriptional regulator